MRILSLEGMAGGRRPMLLLLFGILAFPRPASIRTFLEPYQLCASWGPQSDDGCCNLIADLASCAASSTAPVRTLRAVTRTRRAFQNFNDASCRYRFATLADVQRFVYISAHP